MGLLFDRGFFGEGLSARIIYRSLRVMHDEAVGGTPPALRGIFVRALAHRAGPRVKLHC
jgi:NADH dehydrogenase